MVVYVRHKSPQGGMISHQEYIETVQFPHVISTFVLRSSTRQRHSL